MRFCFARRPEKMLSRCSWAHNRMGFHCTRWSAGHNKFSRIVYELWLHTAQVTTFESVGHISNWSETIHVSIILTNWPTHICGIFVVVRNHLQWTTILHSIFQKFATASCTSTAMSNVKWINSRFTPLNSDIESVFEWDFIAVSHCFVKNYSVETKMGSNTHGYVERTVHTVRASPVYSKQKDVIIIFSVVACK